MLKMSHNCDCIIVAKAIHNPLTLNVLKFRAFIFALIISSPICIANPSEEQPLPSWFLFYQFTDSSNLSAVIWSSGSTEETQQSHAVIMAIPDWVRESGGRTIESKTTAEKFSYFFLPHSYASFCRAHSVDTKKMIEAEGATIIDLGSYSPEFEDTVQYSHPCPPI